MRQSGSGIVRAAAALILPDPRYEESYRSYIAELGDEERYPFPLDFEHEDFAALLQKVAELADGVNVPDGFVPSTTFWLVQDGEILGVSNLRHFLNARIRHCGGHIGLSIRPSARGRGLGNRLMAMTIQKARDRGIGEVHVHCAKGNVGSTRMIRANGGVLESELVDSASGDVIERYVIRSDGQGAR